METNQTNTQTARKMTIDLEIAAPVAAVYKSLTNAGRIVTWWSSRAQVEPRVGGRFFVDFRFDDAQKNMTMDTTVVAHDPGAMLAIDWLTPFGEDAKTTARFEMSGAGASTKLHFVHDGFGSGGPWDEYYPKIEQGWQYYLANLKSVLEGSGDQRVGTGQELANE